jgi:acyl carrier protein
MGLDIVEYVVAVEQALNIEFDDAELSGIGTVGEFHRLVLEELRGRQPHGRPACAPEKVCVGSRAFYRLRKALIECGVAGRKDVAPKTALESLIPKHDRKAIWDALAHSMRCKLPQLERPDGLCAVLIAGSAVTSLCLIALGAVQSDSGWTWWSVLGGAAVPILSFALSRPRAIEFRQGCQTVGGLVEWLREEQRPRFAGADRVWTEREVWETISGLLVEMQGLSPEQITPEASFVYDLGMDRLPAARSTRFASCKECRNSALRKAEMTLGSAGSTAGATAAIHPFHAGRTRPAPTGAITSAPRARGTGSRSGAGNDLRADETPADLISSGTRRSTCRPQKAGASRPATL